VNNIPPKYCTYACVYCQVGCTKNLTIERRDFYDPRDLSSEICQRVAQAQKENERIDYIAFVPDGEPTLDRRLGEEISLLKKTGIPVAVITNGSLLGDDEVKRALKDADWVSVKVDAVEEEVWHMVDRPHGSLKLSAILDGIVDFARGYTGMLVTETMLVSGVNDGDEQLSVLSRFIGDLHPRTAYVSIPTRPPAEKGVRGPDEARLNRAYQIFSSRIEQVEYLVGYEGNAFAFSGNVEEDILNITAVHPMREEAVETFLVRAGASGEVVDRLIDRGDLMRTTYEGHRFYVRRFRKGGDALCPSS
jgi:wyosine [tRNA(Phe)-imidazoG37] synthetase (radical SAM superfamily)